MTEEELNMQRQNRDYIRESQEFLNETVSITAQLSDQIQFQVNSVRDKVNLDHEVLKISKENYKAIANLKTDYQSLKTLSSDREKIERQIQKNLTIAGAYAKNITKEEKAAAAETLKRITTNEKLQQQANALQKSMNAAKALGEKTNIDDFIRLKNTKESIKLNNHIIGQKEKMITPEAMSAALLEKQNEQLEKSLDYLDEEEDAINRIKNAQILFNATFGAVGGLLDKLGMGGVTEILGIKEGGEAAAAMADKLTKGGEESLGVFGKLRVLVAGMVPMFKKMVLALPIGIFNFMVKKFKEGDALLQSLSAHTKTLAKELGMSTASATHLEHEFASIANKTGQMPEEIAETTAKMMGLVGTTKNFGKEQVSFFNQLVENGGYSVENATELLKISEMQGKSTKELTSDFSTQVLALNNQKDTSVSVKSVMEGIANTSARVRANLRDQGKSLATAAFEAKRMGLELDRVNEIGKSTLDFEGSLTKEMEAELMLGKDLNLEKMRAAALRGDDVTVAEELNRLIRENGDDLKGNILGQEAFASAVGISVDEYANIREQQELLKSGGFKDMNEAQEHFNKLIESGLSIEEAKAKMGNDALGDQLASVSYAQRLEQQERRKQMEAAKFAKNMQPLVKMFREIAEKWSKLLLDNVGKLVPVVNAVGKLFSTIVLKVIGGASDMSATIGDKIAGISKFLVDIIDQGTSWVADGGINRFFETVKDTAKGIWKAIQPIIGFFKSKTGMTVLGGIGGVIGIQKAGEAAGVNPLGMAKEVGKGVFNTLKTKIFPKLGVLGSSASKPMFVQEVGGGGGMQDQMMDMVGKIGGRKAGIGGGFKKGFKGLIDYTKMAFKGGRAGTVGRARLLRAGKGLLTGQGASFVGGTSKAASGAGKVASIAGKAGKFASVGKLAAGGAGAIVGLAAEAAFAHFASKATAAAASIEDQIIATDDATEIASLETKQKEKLMQADALGAAGTVAKYTALGASIGSMIPVVGTAVGAVVGFVGGAVAATINFKRDQKFRASDAFKFQKKQQRLAARTARDQNEIALNQSKMQYRAAKESAEAEQKIRASFGPDVANMDHTSDAFKSLAQNALDAGNITKEQFTAAINGTLSPLDLMNASIETAGSKIVNFYNELDKASDAAGAEAKAAALAASGTSEGLIAAEVAMIKSATEGAKFQAEAMRLIQQHEDNLTSWDNSNAGEILAGTDSDSKKFRADVIAMIEAQTDGAMSAQEIERAMIHVSEQMAGGMMEDFEVTDAKAAQEIIKMITAQGIQFEEAALREAEAASAREQRRVQQEGLESQTTENANDFISRPGKPLLKFNKGDLLIGGTNLDGGGSTGSPQSNEELKKELQELKAIMAGFVKQMAQVVDRPITVELDGNKVGQALGQNSYRMQ